MAALGCCAALMSAALAFAGPQRTQSLDIVLERNDNGPWHSIEPGLVLDPGDLVRFRFRTNFDGYLYVINSGSSGTQSLLFPGDATGRNNRVLAGKEYFVPSTGASFKVAGPAGHDVVYWLISPVPLEGNPAAALRQEERPESKGTLIPRCDASIFRARGLCIDSSAGPRNVTEQEAIPDAMSSVPHMTRRELLIMQNGERSRVSAGTMTGPVIYEFRLSHR